MRILFSIIVIALLLFILRPGLAHDGGYMEIIEAVKPAVVTIEVVNKIRWRKSKQQKETDKLFEKHEDLFATEEKKRFSRNNGSGFLISTDGKILTAAHVVSDAASIKVRFANGKYAKAIVLRADERRDVAVLQVKDVELVKGRQPLVLSNSPLREGQPVLVMGGAFGLPISTSSGIISAVDVKLSSFSKHSYVLTDAATNPGSSGGPMLNEQGLVVGLISKIFSKTGTFSGTAIALPATELTRFLAD